MHGLLPADITRRILSLAAAVAVPAAVTVMLAWASPAQASPAQQAQAGRVSVAIDSMSPQTAQPGATVTVTGMISNGTGQTKAGLDVQLWTSSVRFQTRDAMDGYVSRGTGASLQPAGTTFLAPAGLRPGNGPRASEK